MSSDDNAGGKASAPPPRRSESAVSFGSPAAGAATDAPVKTPTPSGRASSGGLTPVAGGLIAGAYDTPKGGAASSARKFTPTRTPSGKTPGGKTPSRTPAGTGTKLPPSRRVSSATSTPAAGGSSAANTPAAAAGAGKTPSTAAARHTPKFTPSHDDTTPIASIKRPRASLTGGKERSTSLTMVHAGAGGKQRLGTCIYIYVFYGIFFYLTCRSQLLDMHLSSVGGHGPLYVWVVCHGIVTLCLVFVEV